MTKHLGRDTVLVLIHVTGSVSSNFATYPIQLCGDQPLLKCKQLNLVDVVPARGQEHRRPGLATSLPCSVWVTERCSSFLTIRGRPLVEEGSLPHVGSTVELSLVAWVQVSSLEDVRASELFLPLLAGALGKIARPAQESWSCGVGSGDLNNTSTIQVQVQGLELVHPTPSMNCWST